MPVYQNLSIADYFECEEMKVVNCFSCYLVAMCFSLLKYHRDMRYSSLEFP